MTHDMYSWFPLIGPTLGVLIAALLSNLLIPKHLKRGELNRELRRYIFRNHRDGDKTFHGFYMLTFSDSEELIALIKNAEASAKSDGITESQVLEDLYQKYKDKVIV